jgi:hypothetical protein
LPFFPGSVGYAYLEGQGVLLTADATAAGASWSSFGTDRGIHIGHFTSAFFAPLNVGLISKLARAITKKLRQAKSPEQFIEIRVLDYQCRQGDIRLQLGRYIGPALKE